MPADHHYQIAEKLEAVARGEIKRLRIHMPPRHGKSELASKRFIAWLLGTQPTRNIIATSYGSDLANDFGREVRNIVGSPEYGRIFDTRLSDDSTAANRWHTNKGGMYVAAGVGSAITGRGAHVLLVDDPFKDRAEADSETQREKVWRWWISTAYTRLESDLTPEQLDDDDIWYDFHDDVQSGLAEPFEGAVIGICTRWDDDDWAGRLEKAELDGGEKWEVLDLPAINDKGQALWPAKYPLKRLEQIRDAMSSSGRMRDWEALYQQNPQPEQGDYFKRQWFEDNLYAPHEKPEYLRVYGASDYAVSDGKGDWTVHIVVGICPNDHIWLLDLWREQTNSAVWIDQLLDMVERWNPMLWGEESGVIEKTVGPFLQRRMMERQVFFRREPIPSAGKGDKPARARSFQGRAAMGMVHLPKNAPWFSDLMAELMRFPADPDDQVDTLGMIGRMLDDMVGGELPTATPSQGDKWDRKFAEADEEHAEGDWMTA